MLVFFSFTLYFAGDENIVIDPQDEHEDHVCDPALVGINEPKQVDFVLSPNPSSDIITIQTTEPWQQALIYDMTGKLVKSSTFSSSMEIVDLPNGIYSMLLSSDEHRLSKRFVVKH